MVPRATIKHVILRNDVHPFPPPFHIRTLSAHCVVDAVLGQLQASLGPPSLLSKGLRVL